MCTDASSLHDLDVRGLYFFLANGDCWVVCFLPQAQYMYVCLIGLLLAAGCSRVELSETESKSNSVVVLDGHAVVSDCRKVEAETSHHVA